MNVVMEGLNGGNGAGEEMPRPRMWWEGGLEVPLRLLEEINRRREDYHNPEYWRRIRREQREREAIRREEEEREVAVNRVAEEEAVLANNELQEEAIMEAVQAEVEVDERGVDASNEVNGDVDENGGDGFEAENALEEGILERVELPGNAAGGDAETEEVDDGAVIFDMEEINGLVEGEGDEVEHGTFEEGSVKTGEDKLGVNTPSNPKVTEDDKVESKTDNENRVEDPEPPKKKKRNPVIPDHVSVLPGNVLKYQCKVCQKAFKDKRSIEHHRFCGQANTPKPFQCPICDKGFISKGNYRYHLCQRKNQRPYKCIFCDKGFYQQGHLIRHLRVHTREKPYMCQKCPGCFRSNSELKAHDTVIHKANGSKSFLCPHCPKRFNTKNYLNKHISWAHVLKCNRRFECAECGKVFGLKSYRDQHVRSVHLGERPHQCNLCSRAFLWQKDLRRHLLTHTDERPFKCRICEQGFNQRDSLGRHIRNVHGVAKENVADMVIIEAVTREGESKE